MCEILVNPPKSFLLIGFFFELWVWRYLNDLRKYWKFVVSFPFGCTPPISVYVYLVLNSVLIIPHFWSLIETWCQINCYWMSKRRLCLFKFSVQKWAKCVLRVQYFSYILIIYSILQLLSNRVSETHFKCCILNNCWNNQYKGLTKHKLPFTLKFYWGNITHDRLGHNWF